MNTKDSLNDVSRLCDISAVSAAHHPPVSARGTAVEPETGLARLSDEPRWGQATSMPAVRESSIHSVSNTLMKTHRS